LSNAVYAKRASGIAIPKVLSFTAIAFLIGRDMILTCMIEPANARLSSGWTGRGGGYFGQPVCGKAGVSRSAFW
jgi:hypothetical protein